MAINWVLLSHSSWYLSWQRYNGLDLSSYVCLTSFCARQSLTVIAFRGQKTPRTVCSLAYLSSGQQLFYYSMEIVNGMQEMPLGSQSLYLLCSSSLWLRVTCWVWRLLLNTPTSALPLNWTLICLLLASSFPTKTGKDVSVNVLLALTHQRHIRKLSGCVSACQSSSWWTDH